MAILLPRYQSREGRAVCPHLPHTQTPCLHHESDYISTCKSVIIWFANERPTHPILDYRQ